MASSSSSSKVDETTTAVAVAAATPNWLDLPSDVTARILERVGAIEILTSAQWVCTQWLDISKKPLIWRTVDMGSYAASHRFSRKYDLETMCCHAVDRSCGHLEHIRLGFFATNALLNYIANSTSYLRSIRLAFCVGISDKGFVEVAKKLPLLEELDISYCYLSKNSLEAAGECCPHLKSLKFDMDAYKCISHQCDVEAFAIAKTMPELQHLQLLGNSLTDAGLLAILDGCPLLESLDLRSCVNVKLRGSLGKRCAEQIKELRLPGDSKDDFNLYGGDDELHAHMMADHSMHLWWLSY